MTTEAVTLEGIELRQQELNAMIERFKAQSMSRSVTLPEATITLASGERYAGAILNDDGSIAHHLILLPDQANDITWKDAKSWAEKVGGALPDRREQALLYANLKGEFESAWYWSSEQHAADAGYAWCQYFGNGYQFNGSEDGKLRARAVRRLTI